MSSDSVFEKVKAILVDQLNISEDSVQMDSLFVDDLNADSLDMVELVMAMEQEFNISIPDEEAERIKTVGDAVEFIKSKA
ncbi:MAG: acyl carrier protein [Clostridiales bacterium]|nr:acyl carrier protein [Clostridiales bacterium]MBR5973740.1 acyl carrier protein [Clostridiales bacterium]